MVHTQFFGGQLLSSLLYECYVMVSEPSSAIRKAVICLFFLNTHFDNGISVRLSWHSSNQGISSTKIQNTLPSSMSLLLHLVKDLCYFGPSQISTASLQRLIRANYMNTT